MADALSRLGPDIFVEEYGQIVLVVNAAELEAPDKPSVTQGFDARTMSVGVTHTGFPVRKTGVNELPFISIGRTRNNDIWIHDKSLSKFQAYVVTDDDGRLLIYDAGSANGTFVDGVRAPKRGDGDPLPLRPGGHLMFGELRAFIWQSIQVAGWQALAGLS
jgi:hypothetical protein